MRIDFIQMYWDAGLTKTGVTCDMKIDPAPENRLLSGRIEPRLRMAGNIEAALGGLLTASPILGL